MRHSSLGSLPVITRMKAETEPHGQIAKKKTCHQRGEEDLSPFLVFRGRTYQLLEVVSSVFSWHQFVGPLLALQQARPLGRARSTRKLPVNNQHEGLQLLGLPVSGDDPPACPVSA